MHRIRRRCGSLVVSEGSESKCKKKLLFLCGLLREID